MPRLNYSDPKALVILALGSMLISPSLPVAASVYSTQGWNQSYWLEHRPGVRVRATLSAGTKWPYDDIQLPGESEYYLHFVLNIPTPLLGNLTSTSLTAIDDNITLVRGSSIVIDVLSNDIADSPLDLSSLSIGVAPQHADIVQVNSDGTVTYRHDGSDSSIDMFVYRVANSQDIWSNEATVTIQIQPGRELVAEDDYITVLENTTTLINVLINDHDANSPIDSPSVEIVDEPSNGSALVQANEQILYANNNGVSSFTSDLFTYRVLNAEDQVTNIATVHISIELVIANSTPTANYDEVTVVSGRSVSIDVLSNDTDENSALDPTTLVLIDEPVEGTYTISEGVIDYLHLGGVATTDKFTYTIANQQGFTSNVATVDISIETAEPPVSLPPVAIDDETTLNAGARVILNVLSNDSDADSDINSGTVRLASEPVNGVAIVNSDGTIEYTHYIDSNATSDTFFYTVTDRDGYESNKATVIVDILQQPNPVNLLSIDNMIYEGAFKMPGANYGSSSMNYSQGPLEVVGESLFIVGHTQQDAIAEFTVPPLVNSTDLNELSTAGPPAQSFVRVLDRVSGGNPEALDTITGLEWVNGSLIVNAIEYYDAPANNLTTTLVVKDASLLATSEVSAMHSINGYARAAGWLSAIPTEWHSMLNATHISGGSSGYPIISRMSVGPSAFAVTLGEALQSSAPLEIPSQELQGFSLTSPLHTDLYNDTRTNSLWTQISHAKHGFIVPGTDTYMTLGWSGGHESGIGYKITQDNGYLCGGPCAYQSTDVYNYYWLWNVNDWLRVLEGELSPSDVRPYDYGELAIPFQGDSEFFEIGGASFDEVSGLLYITVLSANTSEGQYNNAPVVVVYRIASEHETP